MASTYSTNLKIELMGTGENSGTWGTITNTNLGTAFEQAVIGLGNPDYTSDANLTITLTNSNASQAARCLVLNVTSAFGSLTATRELIVPTIQKQYIVQNNTTGGQSITVKTSGGTGITVPNGRKAHLYVDGTNVIQMFDFVDINGGAIDGTTVGAASASTGAFTTLNASGATTLDGTVALGNAAGDLITVPGTVNSNLLFTDATYDIGASGATRPRDLFLSRNLTVGGTLTLAGGVNLNGNVTVGDASTDTLTINSTITSNLIFTDNTYDIGASGATRPRNLFLAGNATVGGSQTLTGALTVDSTTDSSSTTTGSIQTDGGLGVAKALFVGTTANIAGAVTLSGGTANGVAYLNGSKVVTSGSALTFDGTDLATTGNIILNNSKYYYGKSSGGSNVRLLGINSGDVLYLGIDSGPTSMIVNASSTSTNIAFSASGSEGMRLTSTGLGIGTTSPAVKLHVFGNGNNTSEANASAYIGGGSSEMRIYFGVNNANTYSYIGSYQAGIAYRDLAINPNGGNVIIGSAPIGANDKLAISLSSTNTTTPFGSAPTSLKLINTSNTAGNGSFITNSFYNGNQNAYIGFVNVDQNFASAIVFATATSGAASYGERMRLDSAGNVGIGTSSPAYKLDVNGAINYSAGTLGYTGTSVPIGNNNQALYSSIYNIGLGGQFASLNFLTTSSAPTTTAWWMLGRSNGSDDQFTLRVRRGGAAVDVEAYKVITSGADTAKIVDNHQWYTNGSERARIDSSGNLLIGGTSTTTHPALNKYVSLQSQTNNDVIGYALYVNEGANSRRGSLFLDDNAGVFGLDVSAGSGVPDIVFRTAGTEHVRILSSNGNLLVGTTTSSVTSGNGIKLIPGTGSACNIVGSADTNANFAHTVYSTTPSAYRFQVGWGGTIYATSTSITAISDASLKTNVRGLETGLTEVMALQPRRFDWINGDASNVAGFIAQEVQQVLPDLVENYQYSDEETKLGLKMGDILPTLVKAIQEQQAIIESLKARLDAANL